MSCRVVRADPADGAAGATDGPDAAPGQEGGSALVEFIALSVVLLVPVVYALVAVLDVQRGAYGVSAAARAYGRAYQVSGPAEASAAADIALRDQGLDLSQVSVSTECVGTRGACTGEGGAVRVTVARRVDLPLVPGWADDDVSIGVSGVHVSSFGDHRDAP